MSSPRRIHGLKPPYSAMQISTWVTLPALLAEFTVLCTPMFQIEVGIPLTVVFWLLGVFGCSYNGIKASITDPMDKHLACTLAQDRENQGDPTPSGIAGIEQPDPEEATKYCWVCETEVADHAMHCKYCNKCVSHFDHHCQWLNTCVGEANYRYFFRTLWNIALFLLMHVGVMVYVILDIFLEFGTARSKAEEFFGVPLVVAGIHIGFCAFDISAFMLIAQLLKFHIGLQRESLTTYQYIIRDNQRKRDKQKKKRATDARRKAAINQAKSEGKPTMALTMGKHCQCIDPLPKEERQEESPVREYIEEEQQVEYDGIEEA